MTGWIRREYSGVGVTQHRPGPHLRAVQEPYLGKVLLCLDVSGSMASRDGLRTRLDEAKRGARTFVEEALAAHYEVGLVLWHQDVAAYVPLAVDSRALEKALRKAEPGGGNNIVPTLRLAVRELGTRTGDRVVAIFGDGDLGPAQPAVDAAREVARHGIRIVTRGLGGASARKLARIDTEPAAADGTEPPAIEPGGIAGGIAAMARSLTRP